ncbi:MAG: hypothetical protein ABW034_11980 [Steroidobacteraceae bacterium]
MNVRQLLAAGAIAVMLAPACFAATEKTDHCSTLESRFDKHAATSTSADLAKAKELRAEGAKLCSSGKKTEGAKKLEQAVKMIGGSTTAK